MTVFIFSFILIGLAVGGLAIGVMLGRKPLQGSCGGLSSFQGERGSCEVCGGSPSKCESVNGQSSL
ncbi:MAG: hypothetical protein RLZZ385_1988 [Pseudomonadota bacterium]|jgi:hypothetical protein